VAAATLAPVADSSASNRRIVAYAALFASAAARAASASAAAAPGTPYVARYAL
jgi:hypothetical protein